MKSYQNDLGFVYEYGFNVGLFAGLIQNQQQTKLQWDSPIRERISSWMGQPEQVFSNFISTFLKKNNITDEGVVTEVREDLSKIFYFGFLSGTNTINLFIKTLPEYIHPKREVVYYQANLLDPLNRENDETAVKEAIQNDIFYAFGYDMKPDEQESYKKKGRFLRADSIILLKQLGSDFREEYFLLVTDNTLTVRNLSGLRTPTQYVDKMASFKNALGKKTKFSNVSVDTSGLGGDIPLENIVLQYAQMVQDKTLVKSVQTGSYAYSFLDFVSRNCDISKDKFHISIMAQNDYDHSVINLPFQSMKGWKETEYGKLLEQCYVKYSSHQLTITDEKKPFIPQEAKNILIRNILSNAPNIDGEELLRFIQEGSGVFEISDRLEGFQNTAGKYGEGKTFRDDHATEVRNALLESNCSIVFLTGNPGIGKTTVIAEELKKKEGSVLLYTSCRRTVNDDIIEKFKGKDTSKLFADDFIALSTSSNDEQLLKGKKVSVVNYLMNDPRRLNNSKNLTYLDKNRDIHYEKGTFTYRSIYDDVIVENENKYTPGVLKRLSKGIKEQIENPKINRILGTFSIQALKKTGKDKATQTLKGKIEGQTIKHFVTLFPFVVYTEQTGTIIDEASFEKFVEKHPTFWIMIDEITGSDEGVSLYQFFRDWLFNEVYLKLSPENQKKWDLKLIVADASITNEHIVEQFLHNHSDFEHPKIYITDINKETIEPLETKDIEVEVGDKFTRKGKVGGRIINTNSYPATAINLNYHIMIEGMDRQTYSIGKNPRLKREKTIGQKQDEAIIKKVIDHLTRHPEEQIIVYIQDINRLHRLADTFEENFLNSGHSSESNKDYMIISSQLTQKSRVQALVDKDKARCVFMTSSASRGISFEKTTKILAVLQPWGIERELMEQIQLYYRMRGNSEWDATIEKSIEFFFIDTYIYDSSEEESYKKDKSVIHMLSSLTTVRGCLESRAFGKAKFGSRNVSLVPLGGKGVTPVQQSLFKDVADAMKLLSKEMAGKGQFHALGELQELLRSTFRTKLETYNQVYIGNYDFENLYSDFQNRIRQNLSLLLTFQPFCEHHMVNGMLIFNIPNKVTEKVLLEKNSQTSKELIKKLDRAIYLDLTADLKKKLSHIKELLVFEQDQRGYVPAKYMEGTTDHRRYLAIPVMAFTMTEELKKNKEPAEGETTFLDVLPHLVRYQADASSITPIEGVYADIPFITFVSDALEEVIMSRFRKNHLLVSTETNILNLLLLDSEN